MSLTISIIPARSGSKRIPGKNLRPLAGKPLIAWSIASSRKCPLIDRHCVSTESADIAAIASEWEAEVVMRPAELATDQAGTIDVCKHLVGQLEAQGLDIGTVVLLQPTSPFRQAAVIAEAIRAVQADKGDMALAVTQVKAGPDWMLEIQNGHLQFPFRNDFQHIRSQEQPTYYRPNGSLYVFQRDLLMQAERYAWGERVIPVTLKAPYNLDIDYENDFRIAEAIAHAEFQNW